MNMSARREPVQVGAPPGRLSNWVITPVHFNGFEGLETTLGNAELSPKFSCFGHQWRAVIFPGATHGYVALGIHNTTEEAIEVEFKFIVKHPNGGSDISIGSGKISKFSEFTPASSCVSQLGMVRSTLVNNYLVDGTLIVDVHMRTNKHGYQQAQFVPGNPILQCLLKDFGNEETADVKLEVGGSIESARGKCKQVKTLTTTFYAHHYILLLSAPALADMCKSPAIDLFPNTAAAF